MSQCVLLEDVPCGAIGCRKPNRCCQADIGYGCAADATCYTKSATMGCWRTTATMPAGPMPCFNYFEAANLKNNCGTANGCKLCTSTNYPHCNTLVALGGQVPLTAVFCDVSSGISTFPPPFPTNSISTTTITITTTTTIADPTITTTTTVTGPTSKITERVSYCSRNELSDGAIAGISIGTSFALGSIMLLAIVLWRRRSRTPPPALQVHGSSPAS